MLLVTTFSLRRREVSKLFGEGRSAKEIAATPGISKVTVEFHKYQMTESRGIEHGLGKV